MALPARKLSTGTDHRDEALDILRRLEPVLARIESEQHRQSDMLGTMDDRQRKQGEDIAEIKNQL